MVVANFTLQFLALNRQRLFVKDLQRLNPGGVCIIRKIQFSNKQIGELLFIYTTTLNVLWLQWN